MTARSALEMLTELAGRTVPGGCEHCDAEQRVIMDDPAPGVFTVRVLHDDWCPFWRSLLAAR